MNEPSSSYIINMHTEAINKKANEKSQTLNHMKYNSVSSKIKDKYKYMYDR